MVSVHTSGIQTGQSDVWPERGFTNTGLKHLSLARILHCDCKRASQFQRFTGIFGFGLLNYEIDFKPGHRRYSVNDTAMVC